jgi:NADH-quinone oxidoreductase subunit L
VGAAAAGTGSADAAAVAALLWVVLLAPLAGAAVLGVAGRRRLQRRLGGRAMGLIASVFMIAGAACAVIAALALRGLPPGARLVHAHGWTLLAVEPLRVDVALAFDPLAAVMVLVITLVGSAIFVYAAGYMAADTGAWRFFAYLSLFAFAMLLLVLADSLLVCFVGWEGVGLCSYLLIGFWYRERANGAAARKAFLVNRVGDWGFLAAMLLLFWGLGAAGTLDFAGLAAALAPGAPGRQALLAGSLWGLPLVLLVGLGLFLGMAGKSAQVPLQVWLPDAMAGPTPVSALIHAATMVTAGVYLAARLSFLLVLSPAVLSLLAVAGVVTALVGALAALAQTDIKRVLAHSTISQLGFMFLALGVGAPGAALFHLVTHACFKACLFLAAGSVIHAVGHARPASSAGGFDPQRFSSMGGLAPALPRTRLAYALGALAIAGFPLAAGFYSKDEILWRAFTQDVLPVPAWLLWAAALLAAGLTALYVFRSYYLIFFGRAPHSLAAQAPPPHEPSRAMVIPMLVLAGAAVVAGPLLGWPHAWGGDPWLAGWLRPALTEASSGEMHAGASGAALAIALQLASVLVALAGWALARALYRDVARGEARLGGLLARLAWLRRLCLRGFYLDELYRQAFVHPVDDFSRAADWTDRRLVDGLVALLARGVRALAALAGAFDRRVVDGVVNGVAGLTLAGGRRLQRLQTGRINHYVLGIALGAGLLVVLAWVLR